jgi:molecular chaperone DnaK
VAVINAQLEALTKASHKIAEALYQQQTEGGSASGAGASGAGAGAAGGANKSAGGDDVIDAEYIDVDENK